MSDFTSPPVPAPPRLSNPPSAPRRRRALGWWVAAVAVVTVVGIGIVAAVVAAQTLGYTASTPHGSGRRGALNLEEVILEDHGARDKVAVLAIHGVISGDSTGYGGQSLVDEVRDQLQRMEDDDAVKAVVLRVDSPGGEVLASDEIHDALRRFQTHNNIPIVACLGSLAASGGYYVSVPCRWIVAHPLTLTGSIGVIFHGYNYRGLMDKVGVRPDVVKSGSLKDMFSGELRAEDESPEEKIILKSLVAESFSHFKTVIREGRAWAARQNAAERIVDGHSLSEQWEEFADGRILSGTQALGLGLVDELGSFETAVDRARALAGLDRVNVVTYQTPPRFGDLFRLLGSAKGNRVSLEIGGLGGMSRLPQGRLYFLSPLHLR